MTWERLLDDARVESLAAARARGRWLAQQASDAATLLGTLVDLAEDGGTVALRVEGQRRHDGRVVLIGLDVIALRDRDELVVVPTSAITVVRVAPGSSASVATGDRAGAADLGFVELLARAAGDRPDVALALRDGELVAGALVGVGADVLSVRLAGDGAAIAYVSPTAVSSVRLRSG